MSGKFHKKRYSDYNKNAHYILRKNKKMKNEIIALLAGSLIALFFASIYTARSFYGTSRFIFLFFIAVSIGAIVGVLFILWR